jgi:hypothetical protein
LRWGLPQPTSRGRREDRRSGKTPRRCSRRRRRREKESRLLLRGEAGNLRQIRESRGRLAKVKPHSKKELGRKREKQRRLMPGIFPPLTMLSAGDFDDLERTLQEVFDASTPQLTYYGVHRVLRSGSELLNARRRDASLPRAAGKRVRGRTTTRQDPASIFLNSFPSHGTRDRSGPGVRRGADHRDPLH